MMAVLEGAAQELFRVLLFVVFQVEVLVVGLIPYIGRCTGVVKGAVIQNTLGTIANVPEVVQRKRAGVAWDERG
jgi:hypothetical protein